MRRERRKRASYPTRLIHGCDQCDEANAVPPPPLSMPSPWLWTQHYLGYRQVIYGDLLVAREERQTQARISTLG